MLAIESEKQDNFEEKTFDVSILDKSSDKILKEKKKGRSPLQRSFTRTLPRDVEHMEKYTAFQIFYVTHTFYIYMYAYFILLLLVLPYAPQLDPLLSMQTRQNSKDHLPLPQVSYHVRHYGCHLFRDLCKHIQIQYIQYIQYRHYSFIHPLDLS